MVLLNVTNETTFNNTNIVTEDPGEIFLWSVVTLFSLGIMTCCAFKIRQFLQQREDKMLSEWLSTRYITDT